MVAVGKVQPGGYVVDGQIGFGQHFFRDIYFYRKIICIRRTPEFGAEKPYRSRYAHIEMLSQLGDGKLFLKPVDDIAPDTVFEQTGKVFADVVGKSDRVFDRYESAVEQQRKFILVIFLSGQKRVKFGQESVDIAYGDYRNVFTEIRAYQSVRQLTAHVYPRHRMRISFVGVDFAFDTRRNDKAIPLVQWIRNGSVAFAFCDAHSHENGRGYQYFHQNYARDDKYFFFCLTCLNFAS